MKKLCLITSLLLASSILSVYAQEFNVQWTNITNAFTEGTDLVRNTPLSFQFDAGAISENTILPGQDGVLEAGLSIAEDAFFGLSYADDLFRIANSTSPDLIDFAFRKSYRFGAGLRIYM